jgi:hypothetical protein
VALRELQLLDHSLRQAAKMHVKRLFARRSVSMPQRLLNPQSGNRSGSMHEIDTITNEAPSVPP